MLSCYAIDAKGLHPLKDKVKATEQAKTPTYITELKSYLGLLQYCARFMPNLSTHLEPLHKLLRKSNHWVWKKEQEDAFKKTKQLLQSSKVLIHFDPDKELTICCDALPY